MASSLEKIAFCEVAQLQLCKIPEILIVFQKGLILPLHKFIFMFFMMSQYFIDLSLKKIDSL